MIPTVHVEGVVGLAGCTVAEERRVLVWVGFGVINNVVTADGVLRVEVFTKVVPVLRTLPQALSTGHCPYIRNTLSR